jgi:Lrp/AsnC family leucine-responsive transcriptional regulator
MPRNDQLDAIDRRIVAALQADGRLTNLELAERVGLSPSPCLRRVKQLEQRGVIEGYAARIARDRLGLDLLVFVSINLERHAGETSERLHAAVREIPEVISCWVVSGERDYLLQVVVPDFERYRRLVLDELLKLPGVKDIQSNFAIDVIKEAGPLPLAHLG